MWIMLLKIHQKIKYLNRVIIVEFQVQAVEINSMISQKYKVYIGEIIKIVIFITSVTLYQVFVYR